MQSKHETAAIKTLIKSVKDGAQRRKDFEATLSFIDLIAQSIDQAVEGQACAAEVRFQTRLLRGAKKALEETSS